MDDVDHTAATEAALARRERLLAALQRVTEALDSPDDDLRQWTDALHSRVRELSQVVDEHIEESEAPRGLLAQIIDEAPWLSSRATDLRDEHPGLRDAAGAVLAAWPYGASADRLREHVASFAERVAAHRRRGTALLVDAYALDLSAGD